MMVDGEIVELYKCKRCRAWVREKRKCVCQKLNEKK